MLRSKIPRKWLAVTSALAVLIAASVSGAAFAHDPAETSLGNCDGTNPSHINAECRDAAPTPSAMVTPAPATSQVTDVSAMMPHRINGSEEVCRVLEVRYDYEAYAMVASEAFGGTISEDSDTGEFVHEVPFCIRADWNIEMTGNAAIR